ncbi:hypothetical protein JHK87_055818 [Glycine soja]|nr:hypothetical protein JHK87_055818 [Glycine soja]
MAAKITFSNNIETSERVILSYVVPGFDVSKLLNKDDTTFALLTKKEISVMSWRTGHKIACQQMKVSSPVSGSNKSGTASLESHKVITTLTKMREKANSEIMQCLKRLELSSEEEFDLGGLNIDEPITLANSKRFQEELGEKLDFIMEEEREEEKNIDVAVANNNTTTTTKVGFEGVKWNNHNLEKKHSNLNGEEHMTKQMEAEEEEDREVDEGEGEQARCRQPSRTLFTNLSQVDAKLLD